MDLRTLQYCEQYELWSVQKVWKIQKLKSAIHLLKTDIYRCPFYSSCSFIPLVTG